MAVVSRLWKFGKNTGCYFIGAGKLALNPSTPIPKTDVHPRFLFFLKNLDTCRLCFF